MTRPRKSKNPLEREVIFSVIALYLIICAGMLAVHYTSPGGPSSESSAEH